MWGWPRKSALSRSFRVQDLQQVVKLYWGVWVEILGLSGKGADVMVDSLVFCHGDGTPWHLDQAGDKKQCLSTGEPETCGLGVVRERWGPMGPLCPAKTLKKACLCPRDHRRREGIVHGWSLYPCFYFSTTPNETSSRLNWEISDHITLC